MKLSREKSFVNWWEKNFMEKTFADCSLVAPKDTERKLSQIATTSQNS